MKAGHPDKAKLAEFIAEKSLRSKHIAKLVWTMVSPYKKWLLIPALVGVFTNKTRVP